MEPCRVCPLDCRNPTIALATHRVLIAAYRQEARLLGLEDFPPLKRTVAQIQAAPTELYGCWIDRDLAAVAEIETDAAQAKAHIASFGVDPGFFRQGVGSRLLRGLLDMVSPALDLITVSTAQANSPAIGLYRKLGFAWLEDGRYANGLAKVTLVWRRQETP